MKSQWRNRKTDREEGRRRGEKKGRREAYERSE